MYKGQPEGMLRRDAAGSAALPAKALSASCIFSRDRSSWLRHSPAPAPHKTQLSSFFAQRIDNLVPLIKQLNSYNCYNFK